MKTRWEIIVYSLFVYFHYSSMDLSLIRGNVKRLLIYTVKDLSSAIRFWKFPLIEKNAVSSNDKEVCY